MSPCEAPPTLTVSFAGSTQTPFSSDGPITRLTSPLRLVHNTAAASGDRRVVVALQTPGQRRTRMTRRSSARGVDLPEFKCLSPGGGHEYGGGHRFAAGRTEAERHPHQMRNAAGPQLVHHGGPMVLCRPGSDPQLARDQFGRQALRQQREDFLLALGEQRAQDPELLGLGLGISGACSVLASASSTVTSRASGSSGC